MEFGTVSTLKTHRIVDSTDAFKIATCGNVVVVYQVAEVTQRCISAMDKALNAASDGWTRPVGVVVCIADTCKPPPSDIRKAMAQLYNDPARPVTVVGIAIEASGFVGAALRAFATGICAVAKVRSKPFDSVAEAVNYVTGHMGNKSDVSANPILACLEELRTKR